MVCPFSATLQAEKNVPLTTSQSVPSQAPLGEEDDLRALPTNVTLTNISVSDTLGPGPRNDPGEFNCFLNVIVQVSFSFKTFPFQFSLNEVSFSALLIFNVMNLFFL